MVKHPERWCTQVSVHRTDANLGHRRTSHVSGFGIQEEKLHHRSPPSTRNQSRSFQVSPLDKRCRLSSFGESPAMRARYRKNPRCPRFAPVLWALTWDQEHSRRSSAGLSFPVDRGPLRFDLHNSHFPQGVVTKTAPLPVGRGVHQSRATGLQCR
jgi:hypothetical protein